MKTCSKCKLELPFEQFSKDKSKKDGLRGDCKVCSSEYQKKYHKENKDKVKENKKKYYEEHKEDISEQQKKYREENKEDISEWRKKYYKENKEKISERIKKCREEHKDKIRECQKKYREENKEKLSEWRKKYRKENKESINEKANKYNKKRRKTDEGYRILGCLRSRLRNALKGTNKSASTMELVGCSIEFLRDYLDNTKVEGKDYSDAHVDHIKPCASFDLTDPEQQRECFHYTNLQYLPAKENISKGTRLEYNI